MNCRANRSFDRIAYAILAALAILLLTSAGILTWVKNINSRAGSLRDTANGLTVRQVETRFGKPARSFESAYSPEIDRTTHPEVVTQVYNLVGGELFVCFEERDGELTAFSSDFLPKGAEF